MAKSDRLFEVIQVLRAASGPLKAKDIAAMLEVSKRTIYRDIATLQAMRTPIEGAAGIGYVMRRGYDLPPVNFDADEAEAIAVGLSLISRTGDAGLLSAARRAARKLSEAAPVSSALIASNWGVVAPTNVDPAQVRAAIRAEQKLGLLYSDANGAASNRVVWPIAMIYYVDNAMLVAWCELRADFRHFRLDRIAQCDLLDDRFAGKGAALRAQWDVTLKTETVDTD